MWDVIVVGAGVVGATIAKAAVDQGRGCLLLDDGREGAGTPPSGGHLKPSWFGGMKKAEYEPAMELLGRTWGLHEQLFAVRDPLAGVTLTHATVYRVDTDLVLEYPRTVARVTAVGQLNNYPQVRYRTQADDGSFAEHDARCRLLVVATGAWAAELVPGLRVKAKAGVSFRFRTALAEPFVQPWAPYRQVVAHQQTADLAWVGDGTAVLADNWDAARTAGCRERCRKALGLGPAAAPVVTARGCRPYCDDVPGADPCLLKRLGPRAWLATGAGKSGTIAAGWAAGKVLAG